MNTLHQKLLDHVAGHYHSDGFSSSAMRREIITGISRMTIKPAPGNPFRAALPLEARQKVDFLSRAAEHAAAIVDSHARDAVSDADQFVKGIISAGARNIGRSIGVEYGKTLFFEAQIAPSIPDISQIRGEETPPAFYGFEIISLGGKTEISEIHPASEPPGSRIDYPDDSERIIESFIFATEDQARDIREKWNSFYKDKSVSPPFGYAFNVIEMPDDLGLDSEIGWLRHVPVGTKNTYRHLDHDILTYTLTAKDLDEAMLLRRRHVERLYHGGSNAGLDPAESLPLQIKEPSPAVTTQFQPGIRDGITKKNDEMSINP